MIIGIDGCKSGWFATWKEPSGFLKSAVFAKHNQLVESFKDNELLTIGIDLPVVLGDSIPREADRIARTLLGRKASSIFTAPTSQMLYQPTYEAACQFSKKTFGKSISIQSWHLFPKIKDVQTVIHHEQLTMYEIHPELSFRAMNNNEVIRESKKTSIGFLMRKRLLEKHFLTLDFKAIRTEYLKKNVADDDILDALAVLWSTQRVADKQATFLPDQPLKPNMRIAY